MRKVAIVIPTFNEVKNISVLIDKIFTEAKNLEGWEMEVLVIDSHSPDKTAEIVKKCRKKYEKLHLLQTSRRGLGKAYADGFEYAIKHLNPYIIFEMDADLSHDPRKIKEFLKQIEKGADFVIGSRYIKGGSIPKDWALHRKVFSVLGNLIIKFGFMKPSITDWTSGYRAIKTWVINQALDGIGKYTGYVFQVALIDRALKNNAHFAEVPIHFVDRKHGKSKINSIQYIIQTLFYVFTHSSFIRYAIVGVTGAVLDFGISFLIIERFKIDKSLYWLATLISAEIAIVSNFLLNNFWSFSHKKIKKGLSSYLFKFTKFNLISSGAMVIQAVGIQILTHTLRPDLWYVYKFFIIALIVIPYSYILYNKVVWKDK